ncbi:MAG: HAMP domain-containing sensor histidine kinase [Clostridia bacterium]
MKITNNKNIYLRLYKETALIFQTAAFTYNFPLEIPLDSVRSQDAENQHYLTESSRLEIAGVNYKLQLVKDLYSENKFLKLLFIAVALMDIVGITFSILLGYLFSKKTLQPIHEITAAARERTIHNLADAIPLPVAKDELYMLALTFNEMSERLYSALEQQTRFVADASHELKTPIMVISGYINLLDRWGKEDPAVLLAAITAIKNETENMAQLVDKLLYLASTEKKQKLNLASFNLSELIVNIIQEIKVYDEGHTLIYEGEKNIALTSDEDMIRQLIRILLDNALKFTPKDGIIKLTCQQDQGKVILSIKDTGCGILKEEIPYLFERFYTTNVDRNKERSGHGLGLAIAKSICQALAVNISVMSEECKGTEFQLIFN